MRSAPSSVCGRTGARLPPPCAFSDNTPTRFSAVPPINVTNATTFRFGPCELDEARRSLSAHGRELKLQPRVFDLLCYLVRHRERVVSKDELLDKLWPGTV